MEFLPIVIAIVFAVVIIAGVWKTFEKAGQAGWQCIIPIWNTIVMLKMAGKPAWWFLLLMVPLVGLIVAIIVMIDLAKNFGKGTGFGVGLAFLGFIFFPILRFGDAKYEGVQGA